MGPLLITMSDRWSTAVSLSRKNAVETENPEWRIQNPEERPSKPRLHRSEEHLPTALTIPWVASFSWILDAGFLDSCAFFQL